MRFKLIYICFFLFVSLSAQDKKHTPYWNHKVDMYSILPNTENEIIFLGDSITDRCEWFELFSNPFVKNRGLSGDETTGVIDRLDEVLESKPGKIFLMIGVNDLRHGVEFTKIVENYKTIIEKIQNESPNTVLYLQSVLPVNNKIRDNKTTNKNIIKLNAEIENLAHRYKLTYINLFSLMEDDSRNLKTELSEDGLHINGKGYLIWKEAIQKYVNE